MGTRIELPESEGRRVVNAVVSFITDGARMMTALGKKLEWESERIQRSIPVTQAEQDREHALAIQELDIRQLRIEVERDELVARREKASADKAEALLRQRTILVRTENFNRQIHREKPTGRPNRPINQPTRPQPAGQERRIAVQGNGEGNGEGKPSLTHNMTDKLQGVSPVTP